MECGSGENGGDNGCGGATLADSGSGRSGGDGDGRAATAAAATVTTTAMEERRQ